MKKLFCIIIYISCLISVFATIANAQSAVPVKFIKKITEIRTQIANNYSPDKSFLNDSCINTIVYLKFKIVGDKIDSVDFSANGPLQIKDAIQKAVAATNTMLKLTHEEGRELSNKTFLLPVIVYYQIGCSPSMFVIKNDDKSSKSSVEYHNPDLPFHAALNNMLKFEKGGSYPFLDCILINPLTYFNFN